MGNYKQRKYPEYDLQLRLVDYMIEAYPDVIISSDLGGVRLPAGLLAKINKLKWGSGGQGRKFPFPDFSLPYEARGGWYSLSIELKSHPSCYRLKSGKLSKSVRNQSEGLLEIRSRNHYADFAGGIIEAKSLVDWYMALPKTNSESCKDFWSYSIFNN